MNDVLVNENFETRSQKVLQVAKQLYLTNPDWVTFFREVLGVDGEARSVFLDQNDYVAFEKTDQYAEVQQMVTNLRNRKIPGGAHNEATRVITVRLPESLHESLKAEASNHGTSMNKLCISKLLLSLVEEEEAAQAAAAAAAANRATPPAPRTAMPTTTPMTTSSPMSTQPATNPNGIRFGNNEY